MDTRTPKITSSIPKAILRHTANRKGESQIYLRVNIMEHTLRIPLGIQCQASNWNKVVGKVNKGENSRELNQVITSAIAKANDVILSHRLTGQALSPSSFRKMFDAGTSPGDFLKFMAEEIEINRARLSKGTHVLDCVIYRKLQAFQSPIMYSDLTVSFIEKFCDSLRKNRNNCETTISKTLKRLKVYIRNGIRKGLPINNPFDNIKIKSTPNRITYLSLDEFKRLRELYRSETLAAGPQKTLQCFLFACCTGLRISDIQRLNTKMVMGDELIFIPWKTRANNKEVRVPISKAASEFMNVSGRPLTPVSDQVMNRYLKTIALMVDIRKHLTFHVARHSFATLGLELGMRVEVLKSIMGHSAIKTTMEYVHISDPRRRQEIKVWDEV